QRQLDQGELPQRGCQRPHLMLVAQMVTLSSEPGAPAADLESGHPVPGEMARRIACDASLSPAEPVRGVGGVPGEAGGGGPPSRCGKTCLSNLVLVCRRCHRAIHEGGWRLAPDAGGAMRVTARPT